MMMMMIQDKCEVISTYFESSHIQHLTSDMLQLASIQCDHCLHPKQDWQSPLSHSLR